MSRPVVTLRDTASKHPDDVVVPKGSAGSIAGDTYKIDGTEYVAVDFGNVTADVRVADLSWLAECTCPPGLSAAFSEGCPVHDEAAPIDADLGDDLDECTCPPDGFDAECPLHAVPTLTSPELGDVLALGDEMAAALATRASALERLGQDDAAAPLLALAGRWHRLVAG